MLYQTSVPAAAASYPSSSFGDDLAYAAISLSLATNNSNYYQDALSFYFNRFNLAGSNDAVNWDNRIPAVAVLGAQAALSGIGGGSGDLDRWRKEAERYFDNIVNSGGPGFMTPGE